MLRDAGVKFGSHTQSHEILTRVPPGKAYRELKESKREVEERLGDSCLLFSYPNGDWSQPVRDFVAQLGYRFAFTNQQGVWTRECDPFLIPRVNLWEGALIGPRGRFSAAAFDYVVFWRASRTLAQNHRSVLVRLLGKSPSRRSPVRVSSLT
jgi:peptidoglycan/xylan/chitin deacetylase (PgdA/CDA1 family)